MLSIGPQIVFSLYGKNFWGTETSQGYGRVHVPLFGQISTSSVPVLVPKCSNIWAAIVSWMTDKNPELRDPKVLIDGSKTKSKNRQNYFMMTSFFIHVNLKFIFRSNDRIVW